MDIWYQWYQYLKFEHCVRDPKNASWIKTISVCRSDDYVGIRLNLGRSFVQYFVPCSAMMEIEFVCVGKPLQMVGYK